MAQSARRGEPDFSRSARLNGYPGKGSFHRQDREERLLRPIKNMSAADSPEISSGTYVVGDLHVDVGQQRVTRAGSDIGLPNLSFQLLVALVRAAPNVLSNDSLMTQVWPGLVVSPETVSKRVNLLREALGDDPREPRYITGVRSRGYRLIASVSRAYAALSEVRSAGT